MYVILDDSKYQISWKHSELLGDPRASDITTCTIKYIDDGGEALDVAIGYAECSHKDMFSREIGRKLSLTRALEVTVPNPESASAAWVRMFTTEERASVWREYFEDTKNIPGINKLTISEEQLFNAIEMFSRKQSQLDTLQSLEALTAAIMSSGRIIK